MADNEYTGTLIESLTRKAIWTRIKEICRQRLYAAMVSQYPLHGLSLNLRSTNGLLNQRPKRALNYALILHRPLAPRSW